MSESSFYNKISQVASNDLIEFLDHNKTEIVLKVLNQYIKTGINSRKNEKHLSLPKFSTFEFSNEPVVCIFQANDERYFFKSFLNNSSADYSLEIPAEIYQLQRRNDYRVPVPIGVNYKCKILSVNNVKSLMSVEIRDISLGGILISAPGISSDFKVDDIIEIFVQLDRFEFQKLTITVKHIKFVETQNNTLIGASLLEPESEILSQLQAMLMHLDRIKRRKAE